MLDAFAGTKKLAQRVSQKVSSLQRLKNEIKGIIDDDKVHLKYETSTKLKIYKFDDIKITNDIYFILAIGQMSIRKKIIAKYKDYNFETCIHPKAIISKK